MAQRKQSKYRVIYADPPCPGSGGGKIKRGADRHYPLMSLSAIIQLLTAMSYSNISPTRAVICTSRLRTRT